MAFCTQCGSRLPENALFCVNCGTRITIKKESTPPEAAPAEENENTAAENAASADNEPVQDNVPAADTETAPANESSAAGCYTPPQTNGGFVPPYRPGEYSFAPQPEPIYAQPKKISNGKIALIVVLSVVALIVIACILVLVFAKDADEGIIGYWESESIDFGNGSFVDEYLGIDVDGMMGLQVNDDGTIYLGTVYSSVIMDGSWEKSGSSISATLNGQSVYIAENGGHLMLLDGEMAVLFDRVESDINNPSVPFGSLSGSDALPALPGDEHEHSHEGSGNTVAGSGNVANGLFHIAVVGAEEVRDYDNKPAIRIYYEFTNNFDYPVSAWDMLDFEAVQDGDALDATNSWDDSAPEYYNSSLNIRPGITILCFSEFKMNPDGGEIDYSVYGWEDGTSGGTVTASYVPDELPGRPAPYVIKPVENPQWTMSIAAEGALDDSYFVAVKDAELITDSDGDAAIRIFYEFTNNSGEPASLCSALYCRSYQDGIQLDESYASEIADSDDAACSNVKPGQTISCSKVFKLRSPSSPVEAEVEAGYTYDAVGQTYPLS